MGGFMQNHINTQRGMNFTFIPRDKNVEMCYGVKQKKGHVQQKVAEGFFKADLY